MNTAYQHDITRLMTPDGVAARLGLSRNTVLKRLRAGLLPGHRLGVGFSAAWRTDPVELRAWTSGGSHGALIRESGQRAEISARVSKLIANGHAAIVQNAVAKVAPGTRFLSDIPVDSLPSFRALLMRAGS